MAEKWAVEETARRVISGHDCWQVSMLRPDGKRAFHVMPVSTLEWRAAEYGIDPTDVDTLMEIILHEPHMPRIDHETRGAHYADDGPDLLSAENTTAARAAHLARVKACPVRIDVADARGLDPVRAGHRPDPDRIRQMREAVDTNRWMKKYGDLPVAKKDPLEARRA